MNDDPFHEEPVAYFDDGVRFGTGGEMIAEIKALRAQLAQAIPASRLFDEKLAAYDAGGRDMLNHLLALNPAASTALAKLKGEVATHEHAEGRLPFDVLFWITTVAEQLGIMPAGEEEETSHG